MRSSVPFPLALMFAWVHALSNIEKAFKKCPVYRTYRNYKYRQELQGFIGYALFYMDMQMVFLYIARILKKIILPVSEA